MSINNKSRRVSALNNGERSFHPRRLWVVACSVMLACGLLIAAILFMLDNTFHTLSKPKQDELVQMSETRQTPLFGRGVQSVNSASFNSENQGKKADPNYTITFPKDHGSHNDFDIEWWYLTANLKDESGLNFDVQWTLFRFKPPQSEVNNTHHGWGNEHTFMAHASVHSGDKHWFSEKFARGGLGIAAATEATTATESSPFSLHIDDWLWQNRDGGRGLLPADLSFDARLISSKKNEANKLNVALTLTNSGPYILQGDKGYSIKSGNATHASHYYSAPFIEVNGEVTFETTERSLSSSGSEGRSIAVQGLAWFDQEWTSQLLDVETLGWDWLSLHLHNGSKIMAFRMRLNGQDDYVTGTFIHADGRSRTLVPEDISLRPSNSTQVGEKAFPLDWELLIPSENVEIQIKAVKEDQYNPAVFSYYEGAVEISGSHTGRGFLELTGY